ncbi:MAG TPA: hypothetical protein VF701_08560 [Thermoanaerobaculia bacterium]
MGNWDFVFVYDDVAAAWLAEQGYPAPAADARGRLPTTAEFMKVWAEFDTENQLYFDDFDWNSPESVPDQAFKFRGDRLIALKVLMRLSQECGQFWLYPDTGEPAIVVGPRLDAERANICHEESLTHDDAWQYFYRSLYGA